MEELLGFRQRGACVWLCAPRKSRIHARALEEGIPAVHLDTRKSRYPLTAWRIARWLRENRVQILNTHSSRDGWVAGFAGRLAGVPLLIRSRHSDVDYACPALSRHAFTTLADHVITTSEPIAARLRSLFHLPEGRISTVTTGIDIERFRPEGPAARLFERGDTGALPVVGMVSVLRSWKGHPVFLEAIRLLHDGGFRARYVIAGDGPQRPRIEAAIAALPADVDVCLTGHREDVPEILRALDLLLIPSTAHEGVPQIGLQALACATPVVGCAVGGIPQIIRDGETGRLVAPGDPAALAQSIRAALGEKEKTAAMAARGRAEALRAHSLDHMLDELAAIYRRHLGTHGES